MKAKAQPKSTSTKSYQTFAHEWFEEVWNQRDTQAIDRLLAADVIGHGLTNEKGEEVRGREAFKAFHRAYLDAFPDLRIEVTHAVREGDLVAARFVVRGTHDGGGLGIKATGKSIETTGMVVLRVQNGKITEAWNNFDFLTLAKQLDSSKLLLG